MTIKDTLFQSLKPEPIIYICQACGEECESMLVPESETSEAWGIVETQHTTALKSACCGDDVQEKYADEVFEHRR